MFLSGRAETLTLLPVTEACNVNADDLEHHPKSQSVWLGGYILGKWNQIDPSYPPLVLPSPLNPDVGPVAALKPNLGQNNPAETGRGRDKARVRKWPKALIVSQRGKSTVWGLSEMAAVYEHLHQTEKLGDSAVFLLLWRSRAAECLLLHVMPYTNPAWLHARIICITVFWDVYFCDIEIQTPPLSYVDVTLLQNPMLYWQK